MIEFDRVTISRDTTVSPENLTSRDDRVLVADLSGRCADGTITELAGSTLLARTAIVGAIAGTERHNGEIRVTAGTGPAPALFVGFADATLVAHLTGYDNIRMLVGRRVRRHLIDEVAAELLPPGTLERRGREFGLAERRSLQLVAGVVSGASNLVFDRVLDGEGAPALARLTTLLADAPARPAVLVTAPAPAGPAGSNHPVLRSIAYC